MIASWPGKDPAIHVYRRPRGVDHRVKPGDDDLRVSEERRRGVAQTMTLVRNAD